jgi:signal transduction histidine kinase
VRRLTPALVVVPAGVFLDVVGYRFLTHDLESPWWRAAPSIAIASTFLAAGLVAHRHRPASRIGALMLLVGFALLVRKLQYGGSDAVFTLGFALGEIFAAAFAHAVLAYPTGRLTGRLERRFVASTYAAAVVLPVGLLLVYNPSRSCLFDCSSPTRVRPHSLLYVGGDRLFGPLQDALGIAIYGVLAAVFIALIARQLVLLSPRARNRRAPLLVSGAAAGTRAISEVVYTFTSRSAPVGVVFFAFEELVQIAVPLALLAGLLRERLARGTVADLVRELERTRLQELRAAIARALDDSSLELGFWVPEQETYVDSSGHPLRLPHGERRRAVTELSREGRRIAVLVHDAALADEPRLVDSVAAAAELALENARLQAELRAQLETVRESRARIVAAGDAERRRIERDLHDGAQQRLVALALELRLAQRARGETGDAVDALLASTVDELQAAVDELRDLAHGVHPTILAQAGLGPALRSLAGRTPIDVNVLATPSERLPPELESTAYFVASEALANAVKHANASHVEISTARDNGSFVIAVSDDGVGGADPDGPGLRGLADRLETLGGSLRVESPAAGGTRVVGEIPCAS